MSVDGYKDEAVDEFANEVLEIVQLEIFPSKRFHECHHGGFEKLPIGIQNAGEQFHQNGTT